jgi:hypothetical protein
MNGFTIFGMHLDQGHVLMLAAMAGKGFIELADCMPPPPEKCNFWCRWAYDFLQRLASNSSRVGARR